MALVRGERIVAILALFAAAVAYPGWRLSALL
jgi:hypothetical protein